MVFNIADWQAPKLLDEPKPVATLGLKGNYAQLAISPDGKTLFTLDLKNKKVVRIDTAASKVEQEKPLEETPVAMAATPDGKALYVVISNAPSWLPFPKTKETPVHRLLRLAPADLEIKATHSLARFPTDVAANDAGLVAVVLQSTGPAELQVLDANKEFAVRLSQRSLPSWCRVAWAPNGAQLYCMTRDGNRSDIRTWSVPAEADAPLKAGPVRWFTGFNAGNGFFLSPEGRFLLSQNGTVVDLTAGPPERKVEVPPPPKVDAPPTEIREPREKTRFTGYLAVVVALKENVALFSRGDLVIRWDYPGLKSGRPVAVFEKGLYELALDNRNGKLYGLSSKKIRGMADGRHVGEDPNLLVFNLADWVTGSGRRTAPKPVNSVPLKGALGQLVVSPDGKALFTLDVTGKRLLRIDTEGLKVAKEKAIEEPPISFSLTPDGKALYLIASTGFALETLKLGTKEPFVNKLLKLDPADLEIKGSHTLPWIPLDVAANDAGLVAVGGGDAKLVSIDARSGAKSEIQVLDANKEYAVRFSQKDLGGPGALAWSPDQKQLHSCLRIGYSKLEIRSLRIGPDDAPEKLKFTPLVAIGGPLGNNRFDVTPDGRYLFCHSGQVVELPGAAEKP
jgi:hypothetical protein